MKRNWFKWAALALALVILTGVPAAGRASGFTFGGSAAETEETGGTQAEEAAAKTDDAAAETDDAAAETDDAAAETDSAEEAAPAGETEAAPAEEDAEPEEPEGPVGFAGTLADVTEPLETILGSASKWTKKKAPQKLSDFPLLPENLEEIAAWMSGRTASFSEADGFYTVEAETPSFLTVGKQATLYFKDMSTLQAWLADGGRYTVEKGSTAYQASDFWRIDLASAGAFSEKTDDGILWDFSYALSIASADLFGPSGGTDEIRFEAHRSGEMNQAVLWYLRPGELTIDIYYGNGNEVCRELTYDMSTGSLLSSDEF